MNLKNLSVLAYGTGTTFWHYKTPAPLIAIKQPGYFEADPVMFGTGDFALIAAGDGGALGFFTKAGERVVLTVMTSAPAPVVAS